jgi:hypothetical protein
MPRYVTRRQVAQFRAAFGGEIDSLVAIYRRAAAEALDILSQAAATLASRQRAMALLRQYEEVLVRLGDESAAWIAANVPGAYQRGMAFGDQGARGVRLAGFKAGKPQRALFAQVHQEAVAAIAEEMQRTTAFALAQIGRRANDLFRRVGIQEAARGIAEGKTRVQVSREIKGRLLAEGKLKFTDKLGRDWDLDRYAEMVARTTTRQAMTEGTINRLQEHNIQLAQVSTHHAADFCIYYEGVIVSLTEEPIGGYPPLSAINGGPPFHPNCRHVLTPFVLALATPKERQAGEAKLVPLQGTPASLQRLFTKQFPQRARAEGKRIQQEAAVTRRKAAKRQKAA